MDLVHIDGAQGGGQLLRSALTLSMVTGKPFRMVNIRGARKPKPGLMRQHLTCVQAAQTVCQATTAGAQLHSQEITFTPQRTTSGDYRFAIGTGGSTTLVLQTLLPALIHCSQPSTVTIEGGTHNPMAPPVDFLQSCYLPTLQRMGVEAELTLNQPGFMQAGGGSISAKLLPLKRWHPLDLQQRGDLKRCSGKLLYAHLPMDVVERIKRTAANQLGWDSAEIPAVPVENSAGPGGILMLSARYSQAADLSSAVAQMGRTSEAVALSASKGLMNYINTGAACGVHLADQLLLPMALAQSGQFTTYSISRHISSNIKLISQFLPVRFEINPINEHGEITHETGLEAQQSSARLLKISCLPAD